MHNNIDVSIFALADVQPEHKMPSKPAQSAGAAALNRIESKDKKTTSSYSPIVQEVRRELQCAQASEKNTTLSVNVYVDLF